MLSKNQLRGVYTAIITPFKAGGGPIDYDSARKLIEYQLSAGVSGLVACGSTGEAMTLSEQEYQEYVSFVRKEVAGKVPCLAGIGTSSTARAQELAVWIEKAGLDGALVVAPPYNKPTQEGIYAHFAAIKKVSGLPLVAYNIPGRAVVNIQPATVARLASDNLIIGLKDSTASLEQHMDLLALLGDAISIMSGEDGLVHALMACGAKGVICATANIAPKVFVELCASALQKDFESALQHQLAALPIVRAMFIETNPIPVKAALALRGIIASGAVRLPLTDAKAETVQRLKQVLKL